MFRLVVEDTFSLTGLGMVAVGTIATGTVRKGDVLELLSGEKRRSVRVVQIETFGATIENASAGPQQVGICIDVARSEVNAGDVLSSPGGPPK